MRIGWWKWVNKRERIVKLNRIKIRAVVRIGLKCGVRNKKTPFVVLLVLKESLWDKKKGSVIKNGVAIKTLQISLFKGFCCSKK